MCKRKRQKENNHLHKRRAWRYHRGDHESLRFMITPLVSSNSSCIDDCFRFVFYACTLYCLPFDLRFLITPLVSWNSYCMDDCFPFAGVIRNHKSKGRQDNGQRKKRTGKQSSTQEEFEDTTGVISFWSPLWYLQTILL
jgi:hypothetical protein